MKDRFIPSNDETTHTWSLLMAPYVQACEVKASPATIWKTCFAPMKWENWDPDITHLENNLRGDVALATGTSFDFVMKESSIQKIPVVLTEVREYEVIKYEGRVLQGAMKFDATIEVSPISETLSSVRYSFEMFGVLGSVIHFFNPKPVTHGVEMGLANIKRLSEEEAAALS